MSQLPSAGARTVAVTGGASGIGAACCRLFAARGDRVFMLDRDAAAAAAVAGPGIAFIAADVADAAQVERAFAQVAAHGPLRVLVNSAGVESRLLIDTMREQDWDRVLGVNLKGTMLCTQAAARAMPGGGSIVNIASVAGKRMSYSGDAAYTASKGAVLAFTRHAAFELAARRIRVNAVCPGPTLTPMIERSLSRERQDAVVATVPLGRWVLPDDVARAVAFLAGDDAAMCTGTSIDVDGGVLVSNGRPHAEYFAARG